MNNINIHPIAYCSTTAAIPMTSEVTISEDTEPLLSTNRPITTMGSQQAMEKSSCPLLKGVHNTFQWHTPTKPATYLAGTKKSKIHAVACRCQTDLFMVNEQVICPEISFNLLDLLHRDKNHPEHKKQDLLCEDVNDIPPNILTTTSLEGGWVFKDKTLNLNHLLAQENEQ